MTHTENLILEIETHLSRKLTRMQKVSVEFLGSRGMDALTIIYSQGW